MRHVSPNRLWLQTRTPKRQSILDFSFANAPALEVTIAASVLKSALNPSNRCSRCLCRQAVSLLPEEAVAHTCPQKSFTRWNKKTERSETQIKSSSKSWIES